MANFTENNLLYHIFSKSPVSDATTLAQSLNKSGHTLTTDDIFGEELPAFYDVANTTERNDLTAYNNDVCKIGNNFYYYTLKEDGSYGWLDRSAIADGECLFNRSSEYKNNGTDWKNNTEGAVVKYHKDKDGEFITKDNNGVNGNKFTVRVKKTDGNYIKQFISVTDKIVDSRTSNGYAPLVLQSGSVMEENAKYKDASSDNQRYIANCYAGIIQFPVQKSGTTVASNIKISVWEYIGKTLTDVLKGFATVDSGFNYRVADSYPAPSADLKGWVYLIPASKEEDNNIYNEFICVDDENGNWKWELIGSTAITIPDPPNAGDFLKLESNTYSVKTSDEIEDESGLPDSDKTVPTTQAVYKHTSDAEIHIPSDSASGSYSGAQTVEGESCHGFILNTNENTRIESIIIVQTNKLGAQWNNNVYCKITDPITDREFISPKFEGGSVLPHSAIYFVKDGKKANGVNEVPYLVKGRDYKLTFWSSDTHEPISINVPYIEPRQTPNAHFGKFITHRILLSGEVVECSYPDIAASPYDIQNAFKAAGYTIIPVTRRCDNVHFIDVANEIANIYDALDTNEFKSGKLIEFSGNTIAVKTSNEIIDNPDVTVDSEVLFDTLVNKEDYIKNTIEVRDEIEEIGDYSYNSITDASSSNSGNYVGICYRPQKNATVTSFQISEINLNEGRYLHVYKYNAGNLEHITVSNGTQTVTDRNENFSGHASYDAKWQFTGFTVKENEEYHLFLRREQTQNASNVQSRIKVYTNYSNSDFVLDGSGHKDTGWKANFTVEGKEIEITTTEIVTKTENLTDYTIPTEFYGEFIRNKHDISHKYDRTNNVVSFNDGIIKFSDGTERYFDVQKAVIAKYLFRVASNSESSSITSFNERNEFHQWNNDKYRNDFYYEYDVFDGDIVDDIDDNGKEKLSTLQNVINGKNLFLRSQLTKFNDDLSCLMYALQMFALSKKLTTFRSALPSLTNGIKMFNGCSALTKFETKLPNLALAECMFRNNTSLTEINTCLPNLTQAQGMFGGCSNLSKIRFSKNSFQCLYNGCDMFNGCSSLTSFHYELPYLETADDMFLGCKLDLESVKIIAESLYDFGTKNSNGYAADGRKHVITFGVADGVAAQATQYKTLMENKGWVVEGI